MGRPGTKNKPSAKKTASSRSNIATARAAKKKKLTQKVLSPQQLAFVEDYLANGSNGAHAAQMAGYSEPYTNAGRSVLQNPLVQELVAKRRQELIANRKANPERVMAEHESVGFSDIVTIIRAVAKAEDQIEALNKLCFEDRHSIKKIEFDPATGRITKIEQHAKHPSLTSMEKMLGMNDEKVDVRVNRGIPIEVARDILAALNNQATDPPPPKLSTDGNVIEDAEVIGDDSKYDDTVSVTIDPQDRQLDLDAARAALDSRKPGAQK